MKDFLYIHTLYILGNLGRTQVKMWPSKEFALDLQSTTCSTIYIFLIETSPLTASEGKFT